MRFIVCRLFLVLFVGCQLCAQLDAQVAVTKILSPEDTSAWAIHEQSGRIFAAVKSADSIVEYDMAGKKVRAFQVEAEPTEMVVKGNRLIVGCLKAACFSVIDLETNKVVGKVGLSSPGPRGLFCSKVENDFVYGFCGNRGSGSELFQVDIAKLSVAKRSFLRGWGQTSVSNVAMSADGKWIVPDARGKVSPSGADLMKVDETKFEFVQAMDHHRTFGQIEAGPANRYWTLGQKLYGLELKEPIRSFSGSPTVIHPTYDLVASFNSEGLCFETFSDARLLTAIGMKFTAEAPKVAGKSGARRAPKKSNPSFAKSNVLVRFALQGSHVVVAAGRYCRIIDLNDLKIPLKPLLMIDMPSTVETASRRQIKIPVGLTNESLAEKTTFEILRGPKNAKITNNHVVWTPSDEDIGQHSIVVIAKNNDSTDELTVEVDVQSIKLELDFMVRNMHVDPNGKYAVAWGQKIPENLRGSFGFRSPHETGSDEVAVLDLETEEVVVQRSLASGVESALIQSPYVFLIPKSGNVLFRFSKDTLGDSKRMFLNDKAIGVFPYLQNTVGVMVGSSNMIINKLDPETMKSLGKESLRHSSNHRTGGTPYFVVAPGMINFRGKLINFENGSVAALQFNPGLKKLVDVPTPNVQSHLMHRLNVSSEMFGRVLSGNNIISGTGVTVAQLSGRRVFSTPHSPVAFAVRHEEMREGQIYGTKTYLETISLVDGAVLDSRVFDASNHRNSMNHRQMNNFFPFKEKVVYVEGNKIFVMPIVKSVVESAPIPLHFPHAKIDVLGVKKPHKVSFKAKGGKGKIQYQLFSEYPGIEINEATGEVTLDTPLMWKNYLDSYLATPKDPLAAMRLRELHKTQHMPDKKYEEELGEPLPKDKLAFVVPINVAATDEEEQEDRISIYAIVHAPKNVLEATDAKAGKLEAEENKRRSELRAAARLVQEKHARLANEKRMAERAQAKAGTGEKDLEARLKALEQRARRIEAALDAVLSKLEKIEKAQTGK